MSRVIIASIENEFHRYRQLAERALAQVPADRVSSPGLSGGMSLITSVKHLSGNLKSRWTDFLTSDGEKDWRDRDSEFVEENLTKEDLLRIWAEGWGILEKSLAELNDDHLKHVVTIRKQSLSVIDALQRSLAHASYHVGQIVYLAKHLAGTNWQSLTIPLGGSNNYNQNPNMEKPR